MNLLGLGAGIGVGMLFSMPLGMALENMALGYFIGLVFGVPLGLGFSYAFKKREEQAEARARNDKDNR